LNEWVAFKKQGRWFVCKLCDAGNKEKEKMSYAAAKIHEISEEHVFQIEKEEWDLKNAWGAGVSGDGDWGEWGVNNSDWTKVDRQTLIIEYWYKGVQAADRGEELKFELFLETLED
jgi:hypothetical protein